MKQFIIWDKETNLNGCEPKIWFQEYPRSKEHTLILVDNINIYWLEDIKAQGFTGATDEQIVEKFILHLEEEEKKIQQQIEEEQNQQQQQEEQEKTENEKLKEQIKNMQLEHSLAMAELIEKVEKDKVDLSAAIAEVIEMQINGGTV